GTDGTLTHTTTVGLTIQTGPNFTLTVNPTTITVRKGNSGSTVVTVAQSGGSAPVSLSISGLPSNVTATFSPTSLVSGNSTLTLSTKPNTTRATFSLTVTGTNSTGTRSTPLTLTVQ
ncbi:MAG TPA: hypothetical protein VGH38_30650, partial [Bryobacteraceae bacterium]